MREFFKSYYVWPRFPSLSLSGGSCALSCKHCNSVFLRGMQNCSDSRRLLQSCKHIQMEGGVGVLLSGGCDKKGEMLNLRKLLPTIKRVKEETDLVVKLHTGLVDEELAHDIVDAGVNVASMEFIGSDETIDDVLGLSLTVEDYVKTFENLRDAGMPYIAPHVCIGLDHGEIRGEFVALERIKEIFDPSVFVFIVLKPTKGTVFSKVNNPRASDVEEIISKGRKMFPDSELSLGCMRPRNNGRNVIELAALRGGVNRMEIPSEDTLKAARDMGYEIRNIDACCALPVEFEDRAIR